MHLLFWSINPLRQCSLFSWIIALTKLQSWWLESTASRLEVEGAYHPSNPFCLDLDIYLAFYSFLRFFSNSPCKSMGYVVIDGEPSLIFKQRSNDRQTQVTDFWVIKSICISCMNGKQFSGGARNPTKGIQRNAKMLYLEASLILTMYIVYT